MAKRTGSPRAKNRTKIPAAPSSSDFPVGAPARHEALAGEAADELAANATTGHSATVEEVVKQHIAAPNEHPEQAERDTLEEHVVAMLAQTTDVLRRVIIAIDQDEKPFVRVIGRIVYILTSDGVHKTCTATPIAVALLLFLADHLDAEHRQAGTTRASIDVTEPNLQKLLYKRLDKLTSTDLRLALKEPSGRGYRLNEDGILIFHSWPDDVAFDPRNAALWEKKRPTHKVGGSPRSSSTRR